MATTFREQDAEDGCAADRIERLYALGSLDGSGRRLPKDVHGIGARADQTHSRRTLIALTAVMLSAAAGGRLNDVRFAIDCRSTFVRPAGCAVVDDADRAPGVAEMKGGIEMPPFI
jgi:hypothetical protein